MKRVVFAVLFIASLFVSQSAWAVDLATAFGVAGLPPAISAVSGNVCHFSATHNGVPSADQTFIAITANGTDNATISLICNGVSFTSSIPNVSVGGKTGAVTLPQTVTSSGPGSWTLIITPQLTFTITAQ